MEKETLIKTLQKIGSDLKKFRLTAKLSQNDLSKLTGINQSFLSKIESGSLNNLSLKTIIKIFGSLKNCEIEIKIK